MSFIEEEIIFDTSHPFNWFRSVLLILFLGPFRLVMAISSKVMYVKKAILESVLLVSAVISMIILVMNVLVQLYTGSFSLTKGTFPIFIMIFSSVILFSAYLVFSTLDIMILETIKPLQKYESKPLEKNEDEIVQEDATVPEEGTLLSSQIEEPSAMEAEQASKSAISEGSNKHTDEPYVTFLDNFLCEESIKIKKSDVGLLLSEDAMKLLQEEMQKSVNPSKYIPEVILNSLIPKEGINDNLTIDALDISVIPNSFKALA